MMSSVRRTISSRRNLTKKADRPEWEQAHSEKNHSMRYRLHFQDGSCNLKCDRITLLAEVRESKPEWIERIMPKDAVTIFANLPAHQYLVQNLELVEVCA